MEFPEFKPIEIQDRPFFQDRLWTYQPRTSELTFTNLFIWRSHYGIQWSAYRDWLLVICPANPGGPFALPPIGPPPRAEAVRMLLSWLRDEKGYKEPSIERADRRLVEEIEGEGGIRIDATRDHFDYIYKTEDLIHLAGRKFHSKKNHLNAFRRIYSYRFEPLRDDLIPGCLDMTEAWCEEHRCEDDMNLMDEWEAVRETLIHFSELQVQGGVILIDQKVEAFSVGELLNENTAVIHVEKANPEIRGLYTAINQQFCEHNWSRAEFVNREQDLGEPGLRQAKLSYPSGYLEEKFRIRLTE